MEDEEEAIVEEREAQERLHNATGEIQEEIWEGN